MGEIARRLSRRRTANIKRSIRLWILSIAGRLHEAAWSYDADAERRTDRAMWTLFWVAVAVILILMLPRHGA